MQWYEIHIKKKIMFHKISQWSILTIKTVGSKIKFLLFNYGNTEATHKFCKSLTHLLSRS